MGCPVPKIVKGSGGASLMKDPDKAVAIVKSIVKHVKKPVTVKTRLGWDSKSLNVVEFAKRLEKAGASAIAIHGRTRVKMYEGNADYELIKQVKEALSIPVIVNGDITTTQKAEEVLAYTKADALMIGRGVLGRPWFVKEVVEALDGKKIEEISFEERFEIALLHAQRLVELKGENLGIKEMRGQLGWYLKGLPNSHKVKDDLAKMNSLEDFDRIMKNYQNELENKD
jgi:nifR3 family TIM-barrel protein